MDNKPKIPKEVLEALMEQPGFLEASPQEQDSLINEIAQEKFNKIPKAEGLMGGIESLRNKIIQSPFGEQGVKKRVQDVLVSFGGPSREEVIGKETQKNRTQLLPMLGQAIGGDVGGGLGATGGAMLGQGANQLIRAIPGQQFITPGNPNIGDVGKEGIITGAVELATRGTGNLFFKRQIAANKLKKSGKYIENANETLSSGGKKYPKISGMRSDLLKRDIDKDLASIVVKDGTVYNKLKYLSEELGNKGSKELMPHEIKAFEQMIGDTTNFIKSGKDISNREANSVAKKWGGYLSEAHDTLAERAGFSDIRKHNKITSEIYSKYPEYDPSKAGAGFGTRLVTSAAVGSLTGSSLIAAGTYLAEKALQGPTFKNAAYKVVNNPLMKGIGKTVKLVGTQEARKLFE